MDRFKSEMMKNAIRYEIQEIMHRLIADGFDPAYVEKAWASICADEILRGAQAMVPESMRGARKGGAG